MKKILFLVLAAEMVVGTFIEELVYKIKKAFK